MMLASYILGQIMIIIRDNKVRNGILFCAYMEKNEKKGYYRK